MTRSRFRQGHGCLLQLWSLLLSSMLIQRFISIKDFVNTSAIQNARCKQTFAPQKKKVCPAKCGNEGPRLGAVIPSSINQSIICKWIDDYHGLHLYGRILSNVISSASASLVNGNRSQDSSEKTSIHAVNCLLTYQMSPCFAFRPVHGYGSSSLSLFGLLLSYLG